MQHVDKILKTKKVDVLFVSETFLDEDTPVSFYKNHDYQLPLRLDRQIEKLDKKNKKAKPIKKNKVAVSWFLCELATRSMS
jgi:hypothetical protein